MRPDPAHPISRRLRAAPLLALAALALAGCLAMPASEAAGPAASAAARSPHPAAAPAGRTPEQLLQRIEAEVGTPACSSDAQCRTLPIGHKACGGPQRYLAWSTASSREPVLQALADELARAERQRQAQAQATGGGMVSNCLVLTDPGALCRAGRCALANGAGGGGGGASGALPVVR